MSMKFKIKKAFTLIELVVSISITSIILALAITSIILISSSLSNSKNKTDTILEVTTLKEDLFNKLDEINENYNISKFNVDNPKILRLYDDSSSYWSISFDEENKKLNIIFSENDENFNKEYLDISGISFYNDANKFKNVIDIKISYNIEQVLYCSYKI